MGPSLPPTFDPHQHHPWAIRGRACRGRSTMVLDSSADCLQPAFLPRMSQTLCHTCYPFTIKLQTRKEDLKCFVWRNAVLAHSATRMFCRVWPTKAARSWHSEVLTSVAFEDEDTAQALILCLLAASTRAHGSCRSLRNLVNSI